jgi:hypothetical protein
MSEAAEASARLYDEIAAELDRAAAHARRTAEHYRDGEIPRAAAHAWATQGHVHEAQARLEAQSRDHARRSQP